MIQCRSIGQAKLSNVPTINNMPAPSINTLSLTTRGETAAGGGGGGGGGPAQPDGSVAFKLLVKRAGKQVTKELAVPEDSKVALSSRRKLEEEKTERDELKRLVLDYHDRDDDDNGLKSLKSIAIHQREIKSTSYSGGDSGRGELTSLSYGLVTRGGQRGGGGSSSGATRDHNRRRR
eukprot:505017-Prorocentrum_minimum.AAC.1